MIDLGAGVGVDADRVGAELAALARFNEAEPPAVTRVVYGDEDRAARRYLIGLFEEAGLSVRVDPIGNTFATWGVPGPDRAAVATGSHADAIPGAGMFDGTVGVVGGLEAIRALRRSGFRPARPITLILFTSEEPTRFGVGCLGSRAMAGLLDAAALGRLRDDRGRTLDDWRADAGFSGRTSDVRVEPGRFSAFVELHIEQGPILERRSMPVGVVTAIAAPATLRVRITGEGGHAGTVSMPDRRDALCGAAEAILAVESAARGVGSPDAVATVGVCRVAPGAVNGIPSEVSIEVDVRDVDPAPRDRVVAEVTEAIARIAARRGLGASVDVLNLDPPARSDGAVVAAIEAACRAEAIPHLPMVSRAYHDALFMARIAPTAMIFVPSRGGHSHRPEEFTPIDQIAAGVAVLARTLAALAGPAGGGG